MGRMTMSQSGDAEAKRETGPSPPAARVVDWAPPPGTLPSFLEAWRARGPPGLGWLRLMGDLKATPYWAESLWA